jgi:hypothetical protein
LEYNIPVRLAQLRNHQIIKHQTDIIRELRNRGIKVSQSEFSLWVNGVNDPPKAVLVLSEADKILTGWERDAKNKTI